MPRRLCSTEPSRRTGSPPSRGQRRWRWRAAGTHVRLLVESTARSSVIAREAKQSRVLGGTLDGFRLRPMGFGGHVVATLLAMTSKEPTASQATHARQRLDPRQSATSPSRGAIGARALRKFLPPRTEGAGKTGCRLAPAAPVRTRMHGAGTTGSARATRPSLRDGLRLIRALLGAPAYGHRAATMRLRAPPRGTPASGCQDHATSPSVPAALVSCSRPVHRIPPHVRDDAYAPRNEAGWA